MEISRTAVGLVLAAGVTAGAGAAYFVARSGAAIEPTAAADGIGVGMDVGMDTVARGAEFEPTPVAGPEPDLSPLPAAPAAQRRTSPRAPQNAPAPTMAPARTDEVAPPVVVDERPAAAPTPDPPANVEVAPTPAPVPAGPELIELVVSADSVIGLQLESTVTSERARVEDLVEAVVVRDVRIGDRVAIAAGSKVQGQVTLVERGGRVKERARLGVRFTSVSLPDGERIAIQTEPIYREGDSQAASSSAKIGGGAIGGAILGGILGGSKGAAIGGSVGAGAGTAAVMAGARNQATFQAGSPMTVRVEQPIVITVER